MCAAPATTDDKGEVMLVDLPFIDEYYGDNPVPYYSVYRLTNDGGFKMARISGLVEYSIS